MLEAPEAYVLAKQLNATLTGKEITLAIVGHTPHKFAFFNGDPAVGCDLLVGRTITGARHYGGMVEIEAQQSRLLFSDGVNLKYFLPGEAIPDRHQLIIGFSDESALTASVRMYGAIWIYRAGRMEGNLADYFNAARQKPQVLSGDFTLDYFRTLLNATGTEKKSAKAFLATDQTIPGVGNGVLQDILYNAGIHPKTKMGMLTERDTERLYAALRSTLQEMTDKGGRNSESDLFGNKGGYVPWLSKDAEGATCPRCGGMIVKANYLGGSIYYCTGCQPQR